VTSGKPSGAAALRAAGRGATAEFAGDGALADAIHFRGSALRGAKGYWGGTQRSVPPEETYERIRPTFPLAGLTRVANITGLDRIDIPTTISIRPNSKSLTTSSGKGVSLGAAMTSAAMEGIELYHAEEAALDEFRASYDDLGPRRIRLEHLPLTLHNLFTVTRPMSWTYGWDLIGQDEVAVPSSIIHMDSWSRSRRLDLHTFQLTSNGLASGNNMLEAINAALFEVIERDAVTCNRLAWSRTQQAPPVVDLTTIPHPTVHDLLDRLRFAGVRPTLFDCTIDTEVPTYMAYLNDEDSLDSLGTYRGYGAHLDPEVAMSRALTEAVQGRLNYVAGSRDDLFRHSYAAFQRFGRSTVMSGFELLEPSVDGRERASLATPTFEGDTQFALDLLRKAGLEHAVVVDLSRPEFPISVVKVIVPGLEGYIFDFLEPGPRARAFVERAAA
jgi:ribosomal protein S12 methylthiotransferase accessory factor